VDKQFKKVIIAIVVLLLMMFNIGGWNAVWEVIQTIANVVYGFFVMIIPFVDLTQPIICKVITIVIIQILTVLGYYISHRAELKIGKIISAIADIIGTLLVVIAK
jgi:uncharacterized membrane protein